MSPIGTPAALRCDPSERVGPRLGGVGIDGAPPFVTSPGLKPLCEAILYRVFKKIPRIVKCDSYEAATALLHVLLTRDEESFTDFIAPMSVWEWIVSIKNSRRRKVLIKAWHAYEARGELHPRYDKIQAFVKSELLPYFGQTRDGPTAEGRTYVARLIQAPHDETHVVAGPYLKPLVGRLKKIWNEDNWCFYASVDPAKIDKWLNRVSGAASFFWSDYSAFDSTWSDESWKMVESIYHSIYPDAHPDFWKVLRAWRKPHGKIRVREPLGVTVEYAAGVCNASGRDDTALANALLNGIVLMMSFAAAWFGIPVSAVKALHIAVVRELVDIAVVGDDSLVACKFDVQPYMAAIKTGIESFGLIVEAQCSRDLVDVTFLGMMPYPVGGKYYWGPTIGRRLYKAFWQREPVGNLPAWTRGVARQLKLYQCVPVLSDLAERVDQLLEGHHSTLLEVDENRVWASRSAPTPRYDSSTVAWLAWRYRDRGLTSRLIQRDVDIIRSIARLPAVVRLESCEIAVSVDDL